MNDWIRCRYAIVGLGAAALLVASGCAGAPVPHDKVASTTAAIRAAEELGATTQPEAGLHLKLAQDQLARAKALIDADNNEEARRMLTRAEADAELAIALTKETAARAEAQQALAQVEALRQKAR